MSKVFFISILILVVVLTKVAAQSPNGFHLLKTFHIAIAGKWDYIAVGPGNNRLYVSHGTQVNILNETTGDSIGVIENTEGIHGIAFDKENNKGFTSNGKSNTVSVFDLSTNKVVVKISTGDDPDAILYDAYSKKIVTCNGHSNNLSVIDPLENKVVATIPLEGNPETAVSNDQGKLYVNIENKNEIAVINAKTFVVENYWLLTPGEGPTGLAIDKNTNRLFSGCSDTKSLVILDASNGKLIDTFPIGAHCDGVTFDNEAKYIFASNGDGTLTVIHENSATDFKVIKNTITKKGARTSAIDETTHLIYLPTADFEKTSPNINNPKARPQMIPGTFEVLVIGL
jgi:YVTN family beta-propeller protein